MSKVEIIEKKRVFDGFFKIDQFKLRHERFDGTMSPEIRRLCFERGDSVAALVWNRDAKEMILTRQFRLPAHEKGPGLLLEVVAGMLEPGETPEDTIRRELVEEIGYRAGEMTSIGTFYLSPGGSSERIILFYVEVGDGDRVSEGGGAAHEHEDIRVENYSWPQLEQMLDNQKILDAKTLIALMWFQREKSNQ